MSSLHGTFENITQVLNPSYTGGLSCRALVVTTVLHAVHSWQGS